MPTSPFDINSYIDTVAAANATPVSGNVQEQVAQQRQVINKTMAADSATAGELAKRQVEKQKTIDALDLNVQMEQLKTTQIFGLQLADLESSAQRASLRQVDIANELEAGITRRKELIAENEDTYNPIKLMVNGFRLREERAKEQLLLEEGIALANIQKSRAANIAQTYSAYNTAVVIPTVTKLKLEAKQKLAELNVAGIEAALGTMRQSTAQTMQLRNQGLNNTLALNAEQRAQNAEMRAQEDQAMQRKMQALQLESAQLALKKQKEGDDGLIMPAAKAYMDLNGLKYTPQNTALAKDYIKMVAGKDPAAFDTLTRLAVAQAKATDSGRPLSPNDMRDVVYRLPLNQAAAVLPSVADSDTLETIRNGAAAREQVLQKAVTERYIKDNKLNVQVKPLTAAQQKQIDKTVQRQLEGDTVYTILGAQATALKKMAPQEVSQIAEGTGLFAVSRSLKREGKLTPKEAAVVATPAFKAAVEKPVAGMGSEVALNRTFDLIDTAVKTNALSAPEAANLVAKMFSARQEAALIAGDRTAELLASNGFDITPEKITASVGRRKVGAINEYLGKLSTLGSAFDQGNPAISSMAGEYNLVDGASLMMYYNRRLQAQTRGEE